MRALRRKTLLILFLWSVTLEPLHHARAQAQFWNRFLGGTGFYLCKSMAHWRTFREPTIVFREQGFLQPQAAYFYSVLPGFQAESCSSHCIITGCVLLVWAAKQLLCSTRQLFFYYNMSETQILTINKQIRITRNQQMKTHKLGRLISASRDSKPTAQKQQNLLTQHIPEPGSGQGRSRVYSVGSLADPSLASYIFTALPHVTNHLVNSPFVWMMTC